ncbi:MAG: hypothetical protein ABI318_19030 [Chthoniobacteraceae bacterium]
MLVLLAGASLIREAASGRLARLDEKWWALVAKLGTPQKTASKLTLVEITGDTLSKHPWPWGPDDFALFFHAVLPFQPAVLAVEPALSFDRGVAVEKDPVFEKMLHDHVLQSPKLVLGGRLGWAPDPEAAPELQPMPVLRKVRGDLTAVPNFTAVESWADETLRLTTQPGWTNIPERSGPRGWCPLVLRYRGQPVPAMVLQLAMHLEKVTLDEVEVAFGPQSSYVAIGKSRIVPIDDSGRMLMNVGADFARVSYDDLLLSREQLDRKETPVKPPELFANRVVMLARTDPESRSIAMPDGRKVSPGEYLCAAFATTEIGTFPRRIAAWFDWTLTGVAAFLALWIRKWRPVLCVVITLLVLAGYAGGAWWSFRNGQVLLPAALPLGLATWVLLLRLVARRIEKIIAF